MQFALLIALTIVKYGVSFLVALVALYAVVYTVASAYWEAYGEVSRKFFIPHTIQVPPKG